MAYGGGMSLSEMAIISMAAVAHGIIWRQNTYGEIA